MTTEREMLKFAAKACGIKAAHYDMGKGLCIEHVGMGVRTYWNPLTKSEDFSAMCAKLKIETLWAGRGNFVECANNDRYYQALFENHDYDREAAWRYAATLVAAKIGGMK